MSQYSAHFDENQTPTIMGVEGTLGTADTGGTAKPLPFAVNPATGAMYVQDLAGASGTTNVLVVGGTLNAGTVVVGSISNIGQIHNAGTLAAGDNNVGNVDIVTIPQVSVGTLPTLNLTTGTITTGSLSNLAMLHAGTLTTLPQISVGTIPQVSVGTLPTLNLTTGTITTGSLTNLAMIHAGTLTTLPQISIGTLPTLNLTTGTITTGSFSNVAMLNAGTVVQASGTTTLVSTVTTLSNLTNGSVNVLTGTIQNSGTTTGVGVVSALTVGTIGGKAASGVAAVANPVLIGGTDSGGTVYSPLLDTAGNYQIDVVTIPQVSVGTIPQVSVGTLPTLNLTTGTITTGSLSNVAQIHNAGTLAAGGNNIGDVDVATGTVTLLSTVTTLSNLTNGSVNILTGTIQNSGTTTGVGVVSNLTNGSINILTGTVTSITNLAGGTVQINKTPVQIGTPYVVRGTTGAAVWGTMIAASGAGTKQYIGRSSIIVEAGTVDCAITYIGVGGSEGAGVLERGKFVPSAGITNNHNPVISSGTNGTIGYWMGGAGTAIFIINYWQAI